MISIPDLRNKNAIDPFRPRVSLNQLSLIKRFLRKRISDFIDLEVKNADFEPVRVSANIKLHAGFDIGYHTNLLEEELTRYLTPWLYDDGFDLVLGGRLHRSVVLNFIEELPYVDYVTDFVFFHKATGSAAEQAVEFAQTSNSSATLVSARSHDLVILPTDA